jgi:glycosyltransferase involved in cell wall biosynthesis
MNKSKQPRIRFVTPMPPARSGIAQYSADLLTAVGSAWPIALVAENTDTSGEWDRWRRGRVDPGSDEMCPTVYQLGNSGYHSTAFGRAIREPGMLVLHDVVVHHGRLGEFVRRGRGGEYRNLMERLYGKTGARLAEQVLRGNVPSQLSDFPLFEDYVDAASMTVVHSHHARRLVLERSPHANVAVVPMGIPLPCPIDARRARRSLGIPEGAFVIASVTHVNPYKRLDVVMRALRRIVDAVPDAILVVAGSMAPGLNLEEIARLYGVHHRVKFLGYVSDANARLVAQAADVCVNLRHPSMGETSASLLRLLGAGKPVLVTDDESMCDYPPDVALRVPVDAFEDEMIAEIMIMLADQPSVRASAGAKAREFVEREHSMNATIEGYRRVIQDAFGIDLPAVIASNTHELAPPVLEIRTDQPPSMSWLDHRVVDALHGSGIGDQNVTIHAVARAIRDLRLDTMPAEETGGQSDVPVTVDTAGIA